MDANVSPPAKPVAIFGITKHGVAIARRLKDGIAEADVFAPRKFEHDAPAGAIIYDKLLSKVIPEIFHGYDSIVFVVSLGAVVRMIAPCLKDKHVDPAVVVVDDAAKFAVSVLSGHVGGANEFTERVARILGATPVITTASDVGRTIPVDILGRELGWSLEAEENVTAVSAHVVNEEPIAFIQETGEKNWWTRGTPLPKSIRIFASLDEVTDRSAFKAFLVVTDRARAALPGDIQGRLVLYRPRSLAVGLGCNRGTPCDEVLDAVRTTFDEHGLAMASARNFATTQVKADEAGFLEIAKRLDRPFAYFTKEELSSFDALPNPSEVVKKFVGSPGVAEPAAMLSAGVAELIVPKRKFPNVTVAVARAAF